MISRTNEDPPAHPPASNDRVPPDIWLEVVARLKPSHVFALEQTCGFLRTVLHNRETWTKILQAVCLQYGAFLATFPFDQMDVPHLQRAAMGPDLYRRLIDRHGVPTQHLDNASSAPHSVLAHRWDRVLYYLVPGGRFLVTIPKEDVRGVDTTMSVWDLGVPRSGRSVASPILLAQHTFQETPFIVREILGTVVDEAQIRVAITWDGQIVRVATISLANNTAVFDEGGSIRFEGDRLGLTSTILTPTAIISIIRRKFNTFLLWNYSTDNRCFVWSSNRDLSILPRFTLFWDYLVCYCNEHLAQSLAVWNLRSIDKKLEVRPGPEGVLEIPPSHEIEIRPPVSILCPWTGIMGVMGVCDFPMGITSHLSKFGLVVGMNGRDRDDVYRWYAVDIGEAWSRGSQLVTPPSPDGSPPVAAQNPGDELGPWNLLATTKFPGFGFVHSTTTGPEGICNVSTFGYSREHRGRDFAGGSYLITPLSGEESPEASMKVVSIPVEQHEHLETPVCQISGRVVSSTYCTPTGEHERGVRILEYL